MATKTKVAKFVRKTEKVVSKPVTKKVKGKKALKVKRTRVNNPKWAVTAAIVFTPKGKEAGNPRKKGSPPWRRFETLRKSKTVGAFLKTAGKNWMPTISRAVNEGLIKRPAIAA